MLLGPVTVLAQVSRSLVGVAERFQKALSAPKKQLERLQRLLSFQPNWLGYSGFGIFRQLNYVAQVFERNPPNKRFRNLNFMVG
jgi:hypothetical protein